MTAARTPTPIDELADHYLQTLATLDPLAATAMGVRGHDHEMTDLSPAGTQQRADAARDTLRALDAAAPADETDRLTVAAMRHELGLELQLHERHEDAAQLNNIASRVQDLRDVFDLMPTDTPDDWRTVAARLALLPAAMDGLVESLRYAADEGLVAAARQVQVCAEQAADLAAPGSFFDELVGGAGPVADEALRRDLARGAGRAREAYGRLESFLRDELAPRAGAQDAVGRDRYALWSQVFLGARVDLDETYAWGLDHLARIVAEQEAVAREVAGPGATVAEAIAVLDADPARRLHGTAELQAWMQQTSDAALAALDGPHFAIPAPLHTLECRIAPTHNGGIYYTGPSDDLTRPGRMWWSVPPDVRSFATWRERTTVYHEGVPGHHLQVGLAVVNRDQLNSWRRLASWTSGHGEGWALYAERLMADLGFLDDPGDRLGMLDAQRMRAARVVFDLGVHLGLPAPERWGGGTWDADKGWELLQANIHMDASFLRFEWMRYLGWPGQAPSYAVGQRLWEQIRDASRTAAGPTFDLPTFHARALSLGSLPLDVLRTALA